MKIYFTAVCPYCGHKTAFVTKVKGQGHQLLVRHCDNEDGGCDLPYIVSLELKPIVTTLEIGGMMDEYRDKFSQDEDLTLDEADYPHHIYP